MPRLHPWVRLFAAAMLTTAPVVHADDTTPTADAYKEVNVKSSAGKPIAVRVQKQLDPLSNISRPNTTGKYDPERIFSTQSPLANKTFSITAASDSGNETAMEAREPQTFLTKSFDDYAVANANRSTPNLNTSVAMPGNDTYNHVASGFDKSFSPSNTDVGQNKTASLGSFETSEYQGKSAVLNAHKIDVYSDESLASKTYLGPGAQNIPDGVEIKDNRVLTRMSTIPDRPLSIDEVRNLINHGTVPNTDVAPEAPSKPLNDPNYKPEPLRDNPSPENADADKNDPVPSPGTMGTPPPENSEPLPQSK